MAPDPQDADPCWRRSCIMKASLLKCCTLVNKSLTKFLTQHVNKGNTSQETLAIYAYNTFCLESSFICNT